MAARKVNWVFLCPPRSLLWVTVNGATTEFLYDGANPVQEKDGAAVIANLLTGLEIDESFYGDLHAHGKDAVRFYTETKVVTARWSQPPGV